MVTMVFNLVTLWVDFYKLRDTDCICTPNPTVFLQQCIVHSVIFSWKVELTILLEENKTKLGQTHKYSYFESVYKITCQLWLETLSLQCSQHTNKFQFFTNKALNNFIWLLRDSVVVRGNCTIGIIPLNYVLGYRAYPLN